jgi:hypothetical protein
MLFKSTKPIFTVWLLASFLGSILACVTTADPNSTSIKGLDIVMDVDQLEEFRAQLRKFADQNSLEYTEQFNNADHTDFSVVMNGDDFHIFSNNSKHNLGKVGVSIFNRASPPISQATVDELVNDLKSFIREIPNVKITERMVRLKIEVEEDQKKKVFADLFAQLQKLAEKYSLEFTASSYDTSLDAILIEMQGEGFRITVEASQDITREIDLIFFIDYDDNIVPPITPTPQELLDAIVNDLKVFLGEIPNLTVTELP